MNLELVTDEPGAALRILYEVGGLDGVPPLTEGRIGALPLSYDDDRSAVALVLAYSGFLSGMIAFAKPCSLECAAAIRNYFAPDEMTVVTVTTVPTGKALGVRSMQICDSVEAAATNYTADMTFALLDPRGSGGFASATQLVVQSNLPLNHPGESMGMLHAQLAVATLFAADFSVGRVFLPPSEGGAHPGWFDKVRALLASVNLVLERTHG
jgi:hypothetical protein